jgi:gluconolactonase
MRRTTAAALAVCLLSVIVPPAHGQEGTDQFEKLVPPDSKVEKLAGGMKFTEGPVWMGTYLVFSDIPSSRLMKWQDGRGLGVFRDESKVVDGKPNSSNAPNGNARDRQGRIVTCEHTYRRVTRTDPASGRSHVLADKFNGKKFNSPNDLAIKSDGSIWFTDPPYGLGDTEPEQPGNYVYRLDPETKDVKAVVKSVEWPNGICFSPDEKRLYVANSDEKDPVIYAFDLAEDGTVGEKKALCRIDRGVPDGIRCDADGNLWSSAADGVQVFSSDGKRIGRIKVPEPAANLCFGGEDGKTLFITARTSLYGVKTNASGVSSPSASR